MNRQQRRALERSGAKEEQRMQAKQQDLTVQHGWTQTHVVVIFPRPIDNIQLTPEQAEAFIKSMQGSLEGLRALQAGKPLPSQQAQAGASNG